MFTLPCYKEIVVEDFGDGLVFKQIAVNDAEKHEEFVRFVFDIYRDEFRRRFGWIGTEEDFAVMLEEERSIKESSVYFVVEHAASEQIVASIRSTRWCEGLHLNFEDVTGITVDDIAKSEGVNHEGIWEVSQIAVAEGMLTTMGYARGRVRSIFESLFAYVHTCLESFDAELIIGETDPLIERKYSLAGVEMRPISGYFSQPPAFIGDARLSVVHFDDVIKTPRFRRLLDRRAPAVPAGT